MSLGERLASRCAVFGSCIVRSVCSWQGTAVIELRAPSILLNKAATFYSFYFILSKDTINAHFAVIPSVSWWVSVHPSISPQYTIVRKKVVIL